jgi:ribosomal protein S18 acetylase RimI-like enzyme
VTLSSELSAISGPRSEGFDEAASLDMLPAGIVHAGGVSRILAEAFPRLYRATFGRMDEVSIVGLLEALYQAGHLSLDTTLVCLSGNEVVGAVILHTGRPIGRGSARAFVRLARTRFPLLRAIRVIFGGLTANLMLDRRIPRASDLTYIEALAVRSEYRGKGIGTRLLIAAEWRARQMNRPRLALHVLSSNDGARRLYERHGFRHWNRIDRPRASSGEGGGAWATLLLVRDADCMDNQAKGSMQRPELSNLERSSVET